MVLLINQINVRKLQYRIKKKLSWEYPINQPRFKTNMSQVHVKNITVVPDSSM